MKLAEKRSGERLAPLEQVTVVEVPVLDAGQVVVTDSLGREYVRQAATSPTLHFIVGGALGPHTVALEDGTGQRKDTLIFPVEAKTQIQDEGNLYHELLQMLYYTKCREGENNYIRYQGRIYKFFVCWLRDHVHEMKGMKYFSSELKDGIDLYRNSQREDGMIWDNVYLRGPEPNYWDSRFNDGDFIRPFEDYSAEFKRIPVENDVEYLFVEGLYYTWKAVGDDGWMADTLDAAIRALDYTINSPYRWSEQYQLLKRGYTIDTWDFQDEEDCVVAGDPMRVDPEKTHFGVMFGDNTGYAAACDYLAEMLAHVGRAAEAQRFRERGQGIRERLNALSWNGQFFTHHVPEHPERKRDLGVDEASQVSLSNAYSLNRRIDHEQCVGIIQTYRDLKEHLPEGSPGEWYTIYPPFLKGFGGHNGLWQYMNAGVTPIVAGELAHGAFQHGYEAYATDILRRIYHLGKQHGSLIHAAYTGSLPQPPERTFHPLDISTFANIDSSGTGAEGVPGWTGEGENDMHEVPTGSHELADVPFLIPEPASNGRRACLGLQCREGYAQEIELPIKRAAGSIYFLHTVGQNKPGGVSGLITLHYADGSSYNRYVVRGYNVQGWWLAGEGDLSVTRVAWRGKNTLTMTLGMLAYGLDNPHPEREIDHITLTASEDGSFWAIFGITLSDQPVYFPVNPISYGIPDAWASSAVIYALIEGLVGAVDRGTAYSRVELAPRWTAAGVAQVAATVTYPESGGYVAYRYHHDEAHHAIELELTGSGDACQCHVLLPVAVERVQTVSEADRPLDFALTQVEQSHYVDFSTALAGVHTLKIAYEAPHM